MNSTQSIILPSVSNNKAKYLFETIINHVSFTMYKNEVILMVMSINYYFIDKNNFKKQAWTLKKIIT